MGRTGTYIAVDCLFEMLRTKGKINILKYVMQLRKQRIHFVQAIVIIFVFVLASMSMKYINIPFISLALKEQYMFIHIAIIERYLFSNTTINKRTCTSDLKKLLQINMTFQKSKLEIQFEVGF